jgi:hypothetical protein
MANPFITLSSFDQDSLKKNREFLSRIGTQIREAYTGIKHYNYKEYQKETTLSIGIHPNDGCIHTFTAKDDVVMYSPYVSDYSNSKEFSMPVLKEMVKDDPSAYMYSDGRVRISYPLYDDHTLTDRLKNVVWCLERDGFALKR